MADVLKEETGSPEVDGVEGSATTHPAGSGQARPRLWPILVILAVQGLYLAGLHLLASRYPVAVEVVPLDVLALPESEVEIRVRLTAPGYPVTPSSLEGVPVLLGPESPNAFDAWPRGGTGSEQAAQELTATTDAAGVASWTVRAPKASGVHGLHARVAATSLQASPLPSAKVLLEVVPAESAVVLVKVPDTIERELELPETGSRAPTAAAEALREVARFASLAYLLDPAWNEAPDVQDRLGAHGFPRAPVVRGESPHGALLSADILRRLELSRRRAPLWAVLRDRDDVAGFVASGFRVILLGAPQSPALSAGNVVGAPTWADVRKTVSR